MTIGVIIILESSCFLQLEFGQILTYKSLAPVDSYFSMSLSTSSFLSVKFDWSSQESPSVVENNKWPNIYRSIWCTLLPQDYCIFNLIKIPDAALCFCSNEIIQHQNRKACKSWLLFFLQLDAFAVDSSVLFKKRSVSPCSRSSQQLFLSRRLWWTLFL